MGLIKTFREKQMQSKMAQVPSVFFLTVPIFIELLFMMLVSNVDQMMISSVSDNAVASVGNANQILNLVIILFNVISTATTILVSQYMGANQRDKLPTLYTLVICFNFIVSFVIALGLLIFNKQIFQAMNIPSELLQDAILYMDIVAISIVFQAVISAYSAIFRSNGLTKVTMYISVLVNIINVVGNAVLIFGLFGLPKMGVAGAAIATLLSRLGGLLVSILIFNKNLTGSFSLKLLNPFPKALLIKILKIGVPAGGENFSYAAAQMFIVAFANICGPASASAKVYVSIFVCFSYLVASSLGVSMQIIVGRLIGANKEDEAYKTVLKSLIPSLIAAVTVSSLIYLFSDNLLSLMTDSKEIMQIAKTIFLIDILQEIACTINTIVIRAEQAAGDIKFPTTVGIFSMWILGVLGAYVFGIWLGFGLAGIWLGRFLDEGARAIIFFIRWLKGSWRGRSLVK